MPTTDQIRAAIKAKIESVAGAGVVHDYERYADRIADFKALFVTGSTLKGWLIRRVATEEKSPAVGRYLVTHRWQLRAYQGLDDAAASEKAFDSLIESVRDAFRADDTLGGVVGTCILPDDVAGVQVEDAGPVMFAGVLAHSARCALATRHFE
jgi:hypothetical protein